MHRLNGERLRIGRHCAAQGRIYNQGFCDGCLQEGQKAGQIAGMSFKILSLILSKVDRISHVLGWQSPYFEKGD